MNTQRRWLGIAPAATIMTLLVVGSFLRFAGPEQGTGGLTHGDRLALVLFALVGSLLSVRRFELAIGWLMLAFALVMTLGDTTSVIADWDGAGTTAVDVAAWTGSWSWVAAVVILAIMLTLFPDGHLPSRRWRHVFRLQLVCLFLCGALAAVLWPHRGPELALLDDNWPGAAGTIGAVLLPLVSIGFYAGLVSLVVRYRAGTTVVRYQLKWLILAVGLLVLALALAAVSDLVGFDDTWWQDVLGVAGLVFVPVAIGLAILRYRLFEIDRILSRTVSYALLTGALVGVYALGVLGVGTLIPGERSDLLVAGSTLAAAALVRPLRSRIQSGVDRRFNRARYDAAKTLEGFSSRLRDEIEVESIQHDLGGLVGTIFQARTVVTWTPSGGAP